MRTPSEAAAMGGAADEMTRPARTEGRMNGEREGRAREVLPC